MQDIKAGVVAVWREVVTPILLLIWVLTTLIVAFAGPFGTYNSLSFAERLVYWGGLIAVSVLLAVVCRMFWRVTLNKGGSLQEDLLLMVTLAIIFGPIVVRVNHYYWPETDQLSSWPLAAILTFLIGFAAVAFRHMVQGSNDIATKTPAERDRLLKRIEAPADVRLCRISSDNHHIKVVTTDGKEFRVLMRLRDAVADIDVEPGFCVHRSHWVAASQISDVEMADGREVVKLACGSTLPVGPKYRSNLVNAGVLNA